MICSALLAFLISVPSPGIDEEPKAKYAALVKEYQEAKAARDAAWEKADPKPTPADPAYITLYESRPEWAFAPRFLEFAEANSKDKTAAEAALLVLNMPWARDGAVFPYYIRARDLLIRDHLQDEPVVQACLGQPVLDGFNMEPYFLALIEKGGDRDIVARACMALVRCHRARLGVVARPYFEHPEDRPEYLRFHDFMNKRLDPDYLRYFWEADALALSDEIQTLLERVVGEFADIPAAPRWAKPEVQAGMKGRALAESAKATLDARRSLAVGKVAPEIVGEDVDGRPMRLSDYRGKVVVLVFWGTWCGPCMRSLPMEKALAERLKDQPFALVGINSDADREKLKAKIIEEGITWRSWFDGGKTGGPIASRWDVHGWPTIIVLGKEGVIRFKNLPHFTPKPLDAAVDSLLAEPKP